MKERKWFALFGWIYRPVSFAGWSVVLITLGLCAWVFWAVDRRSHSVSDTLIGVFPYATLFLILANWIASHSSSDRS